jgi:NADH-quinone oxidoreductase subunit J
MSPTQFIFYGISALILGAAFLAVTSRKIFRSAIWLLTSLVGIAALYFWMKVEFIAAVQVVVYVGGIVVLIIFSIFLTQESGKEMRKTSLKQIIFSVLASLFGFGFVYNIIARHSFTPSTENFNVKMTDIGTQMLDTSDHGFILPFEVVSILLLAAMIGCIVIAMKPNKPPGEKINADIQIKKDNRTVEHQIAEEVTHE